MLAHTKTLRTEKAFISIRRANGAAVQRFTVPDQLAQEITDLVSKSDDSLPWREVMGANVDAKGGPGAAMLRLLRRVRKLTQQELGDAIGMRASHVSDMERGKRSITKPVAKRLAVALEDDYRSFL